MKREYFAIIQALVRCALVDASDATRHQVMRLKIKFHNDGLIDEAKALELLLTPKDDPMKDMKIVRSIIEPIRCNVCGHIACQCRKPMNF